MGFSVMWEYLPVSASSYADDIDNIIKIITYVVGVWLIAAVAVFFYFLLAYRRRKGRRSQYIPGTGKQAAWVLVPVLLVMLCDFGIDIINAPVWHKIKESVPETEQEFKAVGRQWMWNFIYPGPDGLLNTEDDVKTVNQLHLKLNAKTKYFLTATDVLHSLSVPVFRLKQDAIPGRMIIGWVEATKTGTYDVQCAEICGIGHASMAAKVTVHSAEEFDQVMTALSRPVETEQIAAN